VFESTKKTRTGLTLYLLLTFGLTVYKPSFWSDDYAALVTPKDMSLALFGDLRPIWASTTFLSFGLIPEEVVSPLLRTLAIFSLYLIYSSTLDLVSPERREAKVYILLLTIFTLPSISIIVHWNIFWQNGYAIWFSILSLRSFIHSSGCFPIYKSAILFSIAFLTYPPSAFTVLGIFAVLVKYKLIGQQITWKSIFKFLSLLTFTSIMSIYFAKLIIRLMDFEKNERVQFITLQELPDKLIFIFKVIVLPFNLFGVTHPTNTSNLIIVFSSLVLFLLSFSSFYMSQNIFTSHENNMKSTFLALCSLMPLLATVDNQFEYRTLAGISIFVTYVTLEVALFVVKQLPALPLVDKVLSVVNFNSKYLAIHVLIVISALCNVRYFNFFYYQYNASKSFITSAMSECEKNRYMDNIVLIPIDDIEYTKRIGTYSMTTDLVSGWVPIPATKYFLEISENQKLNIAWHDRHIESKTSCQINLNLVKSQIEYKWIW